MTTKSAAFTEALIHVLETEPRRFVEVAKQTNVLPGLPRARDYTDAEIEQLNSGVIRMLLEALRDEEPKFRTMFTEVAIPSFIRQGETAVSLVTWNTSYLVLLGPALAASVRPEHRAEVVNWFAGFSGPYIADVLKAASGESAASRAISP
jgi:hypothetical protein